MTTAVEPQPGVRNGACRRQQFDVRQPAWLHEAAGLIGANYGKVPICFLCSRCRKSWPHAAMGHFGSGSDLAINRR
ncbi:hypothetical protein [Mesorhizobium sp. KR2-14]|uniref:hypothetical protein n=1 Tax=Mesorhizobium sp. KR2-14 TaxID=3156610 RepID=UPI0032B49064